MSPRTRTPTPLDLTEKFIIELDSEPSSTCSTPCSDTSSTSPQTALCLSIPMQRIDSAQTPLPHPLQPLILAYLTARKNQSDDSTITSLAESAITTHLYTHPVTLADVQLLVPRCNRKPYTIINKMATNIGLYHSKGLISDTELEGIFVHLFTQADEGLVVYSKAKGNVERFRVRGEEFRRQKEEEERRVEEQRMMKSERRRSNAGRKALRKTKQGRGQTQAKMSWHWHSPKISSVNAALATKFQKQEAEDDYAQTGKEFVLEDEECFSRSGESGLGFDRSRFFNREGEAVFVRLPAVSPSLPAEEAPKTDEAEARKMEAEVKTIQRANGWAKSGTMPDYLFHKKKGKRPTVRLPKSD